MWVARMVLSTTPRATYKHCCPQGHLPNRVNTDSLVEEVNDRYFTWCILPQFPAGEQAQVVDLLHLMILDYSKMFERLKQLTPLRAQWISFLATARAGCVFIPLVDLRNFICQVQNTLLSWITWATILVVTSSHEVGMEYVTLHKAPG